MLLVNLNGDVELNLGSPKPSEKSSESRTRTRQQTLSFSGGADRRLSSGVSDESGLLSRLPDDVSQGELFSFLAQMKSDLSTHMTTQKQGVMKEVGGNKQKN